MITAVALIPARSGSKRIPNKNIRDLGGHPLLAYTIAAARESGVFGQVVVSTDSTEYAEIAQQYGADVILRPAALAADLSPDIEWVRHALSEVGRLVMPQTYDAFSILRPTSPFRTAATIRRAWGKFLKFSGCDSLRAVERVKQHPGKMWDMTYHRSQSGAIHNRRLIPFLPNLGGIGGQPAHSSPTQTLPEVWVQNASLEIAWVRTVREHGNISGANVRPFFTEGYEGFDLNTEDDFILAEALIDRGRAILPEIAACEGAH